LNVFLSLLFASMTFADPGHMEGDFTEAEAVSVARQLGPAAQPSLLETRDAGNRPAAQPPAEARDPGEEMRDRRERLCGILVEAGASTLLGGEIERRTANYEAPLPGLPCEFHRRDRTGETVFLMVASSPQLPVKAYFREQQEKARREGRKGVQEEKTLGVPALLETSSKDRFTVLALKGETLVWIELDMHALDLGAFRSFAKRVLSLL